MSSTDTLLDEAADEILIDKSDENENELMIDVGLEKLVRNSETASNLSPKTPEEITVILQKLMGEEKFHSLVSHGSDGEEQEDIARLNSEIMKVLHELLTVQEGDPQEIVKDILLRLCADESISVETGSTSSGEGPDLEDTDHELNAMDERVKSNDSSVDRNNPPSLSRVLSTTSEPEKDTTEAMHKAVFHKSFDDIDALLRKHKMDYYDVRDHHNNTPLLLAIKLGDIDMAMFLMNLGATYDIMSDTNFHLMDEAVLTKDRRLVRNIYGRMQRETWRKWTLRRPQLLHALKVIPDFFVEMDWNFSCSSILNPLVKNIAPHDKYRIWKRGNWLRIDSTIVGFSAPFSVKRGNVSLIFTGDGSDNPGDLLLIDRVKKTVLRVLRRWSTPTMKELDRIQAATSKKGSRNSLDVDVKNL
eukprot:gene11102-23204_t